MITSKVFNPETLLHYTENDRELASQLVVMSRNDMPAFLEKAEDFFLKELYSDASRTIHSLKGVAGALGAERLYKNGLDCELLLKDENGDREEAALYLKTLRREMELLFTDPGFLRFSDDRTV